MEENKEKASDSNKFVRAVMKGENVKASNYLEKMIKDKCLKRIKDTLNA